MKHTKIFRRRTLSSGLMALLAGMVLLVSGSALSQQPGEETARQRTERQAVAALRDLGARVTLDDKGEVVEVRLRGRGITDAALAHLKGLSGLRSLYVGLTQISDKGLEHLKGLSKLQSLALRGTRITDAGLESLKGLGELRSLYLGLTQISDKG